MAQFVMKVCGKSMLPDFMPGDDLICDDQLEPTPGDYIVAVVHGEKVMRKYRDCGLNAARVNVIELIPLNPFFPKSRSDRTTIQILATVVEHRCYCLRARDLESARFKRWNDLVERSN